jgi:hypothetical protein
MAIRVFGERGLLAAIACLTIAGFLSGQSTEDVAKPNPDAKSAGSTQQGTVPSPAQTDPPRGGFGRSPEPSANSDAKFVVEAGTKILLNMINSVSTKQAAVGDRIYLETAFPIVTNGKVVIPQGSWVQGTITQLKRPGRIKGRGELYVRFDSLTLPNGTTRNFLARMGSMDGRSTEDIDKAEGKIKSSGNKAGDAGTIARTTAAGAGVGTIAGTATGNYGKAAGIGAAAGAAAGLAGVLLSRGPDATLTKGTTMEMVLDRPLTFTDSEINFDHVPPRAGLAEGGPVQPSQSNRPGWTPWPL